jgi:two-component system alkaline phosphatase synthesis response regulator PhoP
MIKNKFKIVVVDDDKTALEKTLAVLLKEGYDVYGTINPEDIVTIAKKYLPQILIIELMMPKVDGIDVCVELRNIKELSNMSIVIFTNRSDDYSQIAAFNAGADDYILKTTKERVFTTRIKALLKFLNKSKIINNNVIVFKELIINNESFFVLKDGEKIILPRREFELLLIMAKDPRKIFTRKEISEKVWGNEISTDNRTIDVHIRHLRQKLGNQYIKTVKGYGYGLR